VKFRRILNESCGNRFLRSRWTEAFARASNHSPVYETFIYKCTILVATSKAGTGVWNCVLHSLSGGGGNSGGGNAGGGDNSGGGDVSERTSFFSVGKWRYVARAATLACAATLSLTLVPWAVSPPAAAATICLNQTNEFVPCHDLPAGNGTPVPSTKAATIHPDRVGHEPAGGTSVGGSIFQNAGTETAAAVVLLGLVILIVSATVGWRRRQRRPGWHGRGRYRSA
jgi:hypothetical protein